MTQGPHTHLVLPLSKFPPPPNSITLGTKALTHGFGEILQNKMIMKTIISALCKSLHLLLNIIQTGYATRYLNSWAKEFDIPKYSLHTQAKLGLGFTT
jgi:hypothetical protein